MARSGFRALNPQDVTPHPRLLFSLRICALIVTAALGAASYWFWDMIATGEGESALSVGYLVLLGDIALNVLSVRHVPINKVGAALCWGRPLDALQSGPQYIPFGVVQLVLGPRGQDQFQAPGEPEQTFKGHDYDNLPLGMVRPIRITTGDGAADRRIDERRPLENRGTMIVSFYVRYAITDMLLFVANFGSLDNFQKVVRDDGEVELGEILAGKTPEQIIDGVENTNKELRKRVRKLIRFSGVTISSIQMFSADLSHGVSAALADIQKKAAEAAATRITAAAERDRLTQVGVGTANARYDWLAAEAEGMKKKREDLNVSGDAIVGSETAIAIAREAETILAGASGGMADLAASAKAIQTGLRAGQGATP